MAKSTATYWKALDKRHDYKWEVIDGTDGLIEQLTLAMDEVSADYTRLTRFRPGADTKDIAAKSHDYPEEIMIIKGRQYDEAFNKWLEVGDYASRPPGELHGHFRANEECIVLEISYPGKSVS